MTTQEKELNHSQFALTACSKQVALALTFMTVAMTSNLALAQAVSGTNVAEAASPAADLTPVAATITVTGQADKRGKPETVAPTQSSLDAKQPQSIIKSDFIENVVTPVSGLDGIVAIAPSVTIQTAGGIGISEAKNIQVRGFQDGQFNITYDGIPFGDSNDNSHHLNSYFPASNIGTVIVDRGPGTAATIGNATFGGTIAMQSKDMPDQMIFSPYTTFASWNTHLFGAQLSTGPMKDVGDMSILMSVQNLRSDGALTNATSDQSNGFLKLQKALGDHTVLTFLSSYTDLTYAVPGGATAAQVAQYGKSYGLTNDPTKSSNAAYNTQHHMTDLEYLGLTSEFGNWKIDNKLYTYAYDNTGPTGADLTDTKPLGVKGLGAHDVFGTTKENQYRAVGDTFQAAYDTTAGTFITGIWLQQNNSKRWQYNIDFTENTGYCAVGKTNVKGVCYNYFMHYTDNTVQPFAEFEWKPIANLTVTPGFKYTSIDRNINEEVDPNTGKPFSNDLSYHAPLPFIDVNYKLTPVQSVYFQAAKGYMAPIIDTTYGATTLSGNLKPQTTNNYQIGSVLKTDHLVMDVDAYYIAFQNYIQATPDPTDPNNTLYYNAGGVTYKGLEGSLTYGLGYGVSLYTNGSLNSALYDDNTPITGGKKVPNAPESTAALGVLYAAGNWHASLIGKYIGTQYRNSAAKDAATGINYAEGAKLGGYTVTNFALDYVIPKAISGFASAKLQFGINNITDNQAVTDIKLNKTPALTTYSFVAPRNYFTSLTLGF
ncbi:TonB-dependent receptor [Glaciimonas soli]|uniref:TonB-dependent receptor n=1 Tax=Glaciimonas soli TaxID=2590999 RepID=A0A843YKQ0_9BURK|nr:TonB-dependent receptor [Glaciimonas soli]MQQ99964.1 TonB-dependent receptor [Glaciimonas soli]